MDGMDNANLASAVAVLGEIEARCRRAATALPRKEIKQGTVWSGIAFRLGACRMIAPLADVVEILTYPELSYVPNTCYWVRGIANVRGNLLPVADLNAYLYGSMTQVTFRTRVLVVDCEGIYSGIVVDDVMGLRYLREEAFVAGIPDMDEPLRPYVSGGCQVDDEVWGIFNLFSLVESPGYLKTAV